MSSLDLNIEGIKISKTAMQKIQKRVDWLDRELERTLPMVYRGNLEGQRDGIKAVLSLIMTESNNLS
jgi:hypothetical protein